MSRGTKGVSVPFTINGGHLSKEAVTLNVILVANSFSHLEYCEPSLKTSSIFAFATDIHKGCPLALFSENTLAMCSAFGISRNLTIITDYPHLEARVVLTPLYFLNKK
jgi:hypothetical protein